MNKILGNVATALELLNAGYFCNALSSRQLWTDISPSVRIATCLIRTELGDNPPVLVLSTLAHPCQHVLLLEELGTIEFVNSPDWVSIWKYVTDRDFNEWLFNTYVVRMASDNPRPQLLARAG